MKILIFALLVYNTAQSTNDDHYDDNYDIIDDRKDDFKKWKAAQKRGLRKTEEDYPLEDEPKKSVSFYQLENDRKEQKELSLSKTKLKFSIHVIL